MYTEEPNSKAAGSRSERIPDGLTSTARRPQLQHRPAGGSRARNRRYTMPKKQPEALHPDDVAFRRNRQTGLARQYEEASDAP